MTADGRSQDRTGPAENLVAGRVTERIVVLFEVIEVEHDQRERRGQAVGLAEEELEVFAESPAVFRAGELVDRGELGELCVLAGQLLVDFQDALGDLETNGQLIGVRGFGQKVVGAGAEAGQPVFPAVARSQAG